MPQRPRFRRLGSAAAISAGAAALVLAGAPAASAQTAAAPRRCVKGTDPASTLENWKCQWEKWRDGLPKPTAPKPSKKPARKPAAKKPVAKHKPKPKAAPKPKPKKAPSGGGVTALSDPVPYGTDAPVTTPPVPQVANRPTDAVTTSAGTAVAPQTRLVSPVAAAEPQEGRMLWVAAAAGAAGAVGTLQLTVAGRAVSRRRRR
ncbi:hypothetical protein [Actinomadura rayongensis]|uniref:Uncharacterized protein n=1 Tax=Actinomadura rayongensis TaxID=1429076 RepID=A0A6I4WM83_9ACTN|nr:hypothetical protein [Actinomadura rayongensis]MXQ67752.1 hypothetical protein [Actinomadura rayongensis]